MKVKVRKYKKSPAPVADEQSKVKSTIETLRDSGLLHGIPTTTLCESESIEILRGVEKFLSNYKYVVEGD